MNKHDLTMVIDLDERGSFRAHVEDQKGETVFELSNEGEDGWPDEGGLWLVEAGYMKHCRHSDGLHDYLIEMRIAKPGSAMRLEG